jgi:hypothetical protein
MAMICSIVRCVSRSKDVGRLRDEGARFAGRCRATGRHAELGQFQPRAAPHCTLPPSSCSRNHQVCIPRYLTRTLCFSSALYIYPIGVTLGEPSHLHAHHCSSPSSTFEHMHAQRVRYVDHAIDHGSKSQVRDLVIANGVRR